MDINELFPTYKGKYKSLLILGPPGSEKLSIGYRLSHLGDFFYYSFKEVFKHLDPDSPIGEFCYKYIGSGFPIPDEIATCLWKRYLRAMVDSYLYQPEKQLLIVEGFPLNTYQASTLNESIEVVCVILLTFSHLSHLKQEDEEIQKREMQLYKEETLKVLSLYPQAKIVSVNAQQRLLDIFREILILIQNKI